MHRFGITGAFLAFLCLVFISTCSVEAFPAADNGDRYSSYGRVGVQRGLGTSLITANGISGGVEVGEHADRNNNHAFTGAIARGCLGEVGVSEYNSGISLSAGACADTGLMVKDHTLEAKLLGQGFKIGKNGAGLCIGAFCGDVKLEQMVWLV